jgi:hypothetical protein
MQRSGIEVHLSNPRASCPYGSPGLEATIRVVRVLVHAAFHQPAPELVELKVMNDCDHPG